MEEANEQTFKGDLWMAQRLRNGAVFLQGDDGEFTFMARHGLLLGNVGGATHFLLGLRQDL